MITSTKYGMLITFRFEMKQFNQEIYFYVAEGVVFSTMEQFKDDSYWIEQKKTEIKIERS